MILLHFQVVVISFQRYLQFIFIVWACASCINLRQHYQNAPNLTTSLQDRIIIVFCLLIMRTPTLWFL